MSYFKPINSTENNLHIIRATIDRVGNILYPTANQLPIAFSTQYFTETISSPTYIKINYPNIFKSTDIPAVFITSSVGNPGDPVVLFVTSKGSNYCTVSTNDFINVIHTFDIYIIGIKPIGPVFAISNRGWKFSTNVTNDNIVYSDMLIGINTDNVKFNLSTAGNIGYIPNITDTSTVISSNLLNYYLNIITISSTSAVISLPQAATDGQFLQIVAGTVSNEFSNITFDITSNVFSNYTSNLVLQTQGDSLSLLSYNNNWLIINQQIFSTTIPKNSYNDVNLTSLDPTVILNGNLSILNLDTTVEYDVPADSKYNGLYLDLLVGNQVNDYYLNLRLSNIITSKPALVLSNICDHVKLFKTSNKWIMVESQFN